MRPSLPFARRAASALLFVLATSCGADKSTAPSAPANPSNPATETFAASLGVNLSQMTKLSNDLYIQDVIAGGGTAAASGKSVSVTYSGWYVNGVQFDSNVATSPFNFVLGTGAVIQGWDQGLVGMRAGGTRRLVIGSNAAYGTAGRGSIPPNTTLVFVVQLISAAQ